MNHKNFVNLIGYCEEDEPFVRMMVFEYAPDGSLSEHLHGIHIICIYSECIHYLCIKLVLLFCFS